MTVHSADGTSQDNATPSLTFVSGDWRPNPGEKSVHVGSNSTPETFVTVGPLLPAN